MSGALVSRSRPLRALARATGYQVLGCGRLVLAVKNGPAKPSVPALETQSAELKSCQSAWTTIVTLLARRSAQRAAAWLNRCRRCAPRVVPGLVASAATG